MNAMNLLYSSWYCKTREIAINVYTVGGYHINIFYVKVNPVDSHYVKFLFLVR